ncbi:MAG: hypothetical protein RSA17_02915 [Ruthenibacterium sp.]
MRGFYHYRARPLHAKRIILGSKRWQQWLPAALLLLGIITGAVMEASGRTGGQAYLAYFVRQLLHIYSDSTFNGIVGFAFISAFLLHATMFFFSFSCIGTPAVLLVPLLKGFYIGCISGYLYGTMGLRGIAANLLLCFLPHMGEAVLLLYFTSHSLQLSNSLFRYLIAQKADSCIRTQACLQAFLTASLGLIGTSLGTGLLSAVFAPVFLGG